MRQASPPPPCCPAKPRREPKAGVGTLGWRPGPRDCEQPVSHHLPSLPPDARRRIQPPVNASLTSTTQRPRVRYEPLTTHKSRAWLGADTYHDTNRSVPVTAPEITPRPAGSCTLTVCSMGWTGSRPTGWPPLRAEPTTSTFPSRTCRSAVPRQNWTGSPEPTTTVAASLAAGTNAVYSQDHTGQYMSPNLKMAGQLLALCDGTDSQDPRGRVSARQATDWADRDKLPGTSSLHAMPTPARMSTFIAQVPHVG